LMLLNVCTNSFVSKHGSTYTESELFQLLLELWQKLRDADWIMGFFFFGSDFCCADYWSTTRTFRNWWSQWIVMAVYHCYSWSRKAMVCNFVSGSCKVLRLYWLLCYLHIVIVEICPWISQIWRFRLIRLNQRRLFLPPNHKKHCHCCCQVATTMPRYW
jgi:hypothetical protein